MEIIEEKQQAIDDLVELLRDVRSALKVFIKIGNGFKWVVGVGLAIGAAFAAIKKWG